jgi:hypothetical protein
MLTAHTRGTSATHTTCCLPLWLHACSTGDSDGGNDLTLIDQYLSLLTGQQSHTGPDLVGALLKGESSVPAPETVAAQHISQRYN